MWMKTYPYLSQFVFTLIISLDLSFNKCIRLCHKEIRLIFFNSISYLHRISRRHLHEASLDNFDQSFSTCLENHAFKSIDVLRFCSIFVGFLTSFLPFLSLTCFRQWYTYRISLRIAFSHLRQYFWILHNYF